MSTVKFSQLDKLKELQSRIYLLTQQNLSQQEILEYAVFFMAENLDLLIEHLQAGTRKFSEEEIAKIRSKATHWGKETANISKTIDETLYGDN